MENTIEVLEDLLVKHQTELLKIHEEIEPLERKKLRIEREIKLLEELIGIKKEAIQLEALSVSLSDKTGREAYEELARNYFKDKPFKEDEIREIATKTGLLIKEKPITEQYSRNVIAQLLEEEFLERAERGVYRYHQQAEEQEQQTPLRRRTPISLDE